ncbi:CC-NBS-LRR class disease resistance protein [Dorcoceras hygrometricum]|uniref:CC-NBS-LRR class disease resistance protein n=1 Tax=Dorcoceras hygrometricum TaxID=472368 RepID=A0A2Z7BXS4_9LAMI|nr:CC-NBS-LRR class disease resistance protein [Dorcoceras hygrometricum]
MMRRRAGDSADEIVLMMSSVTSSYSADGLRKQSQESAGSLHPDARRSDVVEELFQSQAIVQPADAIWR